MPGGILISTLLAVDAGQGDRAAQRRGGEADRAFGDQGRAFARVDRVPLHVDEDVEVAAGGAAHARLAFAGDADARAFVDAGRDVDRQLALLERPAFAVAGGQGSAIISPMPRQVGQPRSTTKKPCCARTLPAPPQVAQVRAQSLGLVQPRPWQASHARQRLDR